MNVPNGKADHVNVTPEHLPPGTDRGRAAVCGYAWLAIGGVICALSVVGLGERPLREAVVFGVQGLLIALYGCRRLWLARPVRLRAAASSPSRQDARRSRLRGVTAPARTAVTCATVTARGVLE
ncbi:MAG: hypothetical protein QOF65_3100 [Thermoleophilaceae bacterium]|jgi:hypothetical protein|nr:hypothetical protein [Thermoleophilaceae bacterium]